MRLINPLANNEGGWGLYNSLTNTPIYRDVSDLLLIGISHKDFGGKKFDTKLFEFKRRLRSLDHLAFEGRQNTHEVNGSTGANTYEQAAYKHFRGQKHYLDEGTNYSKAVEKYGVSKDLFILLNALRDLKVATSKTDGDLLKKIESGLEFKKEIYFGSDEVDIQKIMDTVATFLVNVLSNIHDNLPACLAAQEAFFEYMPRIRDYEVYAPEIKKIQTAFNGKKGAILGANHIDYLCGILSDEIKTPPPQWKELFEEMDDEAKKGVMLLEDFISRQKV